MKLSVKDKLNMYYPVKSSGLDLQVKDVDLNKRIVQFIANTYMFMDKDLDVLIPGVALKSINDRGPLSQAAAKIKHLRDHKLSTRDMIGKPLLIDERNINGNDVLFFESKITKGTDGDDVLIKYQEGILDNHSIGFRYRDIALADKESNNEDERKRFDEYISQIINKQEAEDTGFFFVVKQIELFEASAVPFGSNELTNTVGIKSKNKEVVLLDLFSRIDVLKSQLKSGSASDDTMKDFELQLLQIKQIITDMFYAEPSIKEILKTSDMDTRQEKTFKELINEFKII